MYAGKDGKVHVFRLTDFEGEANEGLVRTKSECRDHKLDKTKGKLVAYESLCKTCK